MLTNLFIALTFILITLMVIVNFGRIFQLAEILSLYVNKFKSFIETLIQAYRNQRQLIP